MNSSNVDKITPKAGVCVETVSRHHRSRVKVTWLCVYRPHAKFYHLSSACCSDPPFCFFSHFPVVYKAHLQLTKLSWYKENYFVHSMSSFSFGSKKKRKTAAKFCKRNRLLPKFPACNTACVALWGILGHGRVYNTLAMERNNMVSISIAASSQHCMKINSELAYCTHSPSWQPSLKQNLQRPYGHA